MLHIRYHTGLRQSVCGQSLKGYSIELRSQGGQVGCSTGSPISLLCPTCIPRDLRNSDIAAILITREHTRVRRISWQRRPGAPPTQPRHGGLSALVALVGWWWGLSMLSQPSQPLPRASHGSPSPLPPLPRVSHGCPTGVPWVSHGCPTGVPQVPHRVSQGVSHPSHGRLTPGRLHPKVGLSRMGVFRHPAPLPTPPLKPPCTDLWNKSGITVINGRHPAAALEICPITIWIGSPLGGAAPALVAGALQAYS